MDVWLTPKGAKKTAAAVQHRKLADKADADRRRAFWDERLKMLALKIDDL